MYLKNHGLASLLIAFVLAYTPFANADYVAYAVIDGNSKPLPENIDNIEAKELVDVKWGPYNGNKSRVGVLAVENNSKVNSVTVVGGGYYGHTTTYTEGGNGVPVDGIDAILTDVLHRTGRFRMLERTKLDKTLKEQDLGASGRVSTPSAAKIGKVLGAEYLVQAVVTSYEPNFEGKGFGLGGITSGLLGGLKIKNSKSMVAMNFRLVNAETSEIIFSKQVNAVMSESGFGFGGAGWGGGGVLGGFMESYSKTPIGQAVIAAVNKGVYELVKQVGTKPSSGSVIKVAGNKIYLNLGKDRVKVGDSLKLVSKGESLIDPETGLNLGGEEEEIGGLQVNQVKDKYSIAVVVGNLRKPAKAGDKVVSNAPVEQLQFAASWSGSKSSSSSEGSSSSDW